MAEATAVAHEPLVTSSTSKRTADVPLTRLEQEERQVEQEAQYQEMLKLVRAFGSEEEPWKTRLRTLPD